MPEDELLHGMRHSCAHMLAQAVLEMFPEAKLGIGPTIEHGFYYDFELPRTLIPEDLAILQKKMDHIAKQRQTFTRREEPVDDAIELYKKSGQLFKMEIAQDLKAEGEKIVSFYENRLPSGDLKFVDLCRGGHTENTGKTGSFKLDKIAGAYWRGDEKRPMLQRIYGFCFPTREELDAHLKMIEEAKKRDHKKLGPELDLFTFSEMVGGGLPLWTPKGTLMRNLLNDFVWSMRKEKGYQKVEIPHITKKELYEKSGHWDKFQNELFRITTREKHEFAMKPMNCPHHTQIYARKKWSYRELPQRYENTTMCYRDEQSGELAGLSRVRAFTQDDAHVFCRMSQVEDEFLKIWNIVHTFYKTFGFSLKVRLSLHDPAAPEKYLGDKAKWAMAEGILRKIAKQEKADYFEGIGEAAFYGPKLDFMAKDSIGREWQVATIQLDMNMPDRFDLTCVNEKGEAERIVMIHAAIMGSIERFMSVMIEHFAGSFPVWLAPVQVAVLSISEKFNDYAANVAASLSARDVRVEVDDSNESLGKKIRAAELMKTPYMLIVGEKEVAEKLVSVRNRKTKEQVSMGVDEFAKSLMEEIYTRAL